MHLYYGTTKTKHAKGKQFKNASVFAGPVADAKSVTIEGVWPRVVDAYSRLGVPITLVQAEQTKRIEGIPPTAYLPTAERRTEQAAVEIPFDWQQAPWADLRRLAASVSDTPIVNRKQAEAAIEAELERREQGAL
jgi:hypothetical protein